jgi:hypothetical protein
LKQLFALELHLGKDPSRVPCAYVSKNVIGWTKPKQGVQHGDLVEAMLASGVVMMVVFIMLEPGTGVSRLYS